MKSSLWGRRSTNRRQEAGAAAPGRAGVTAVAGTQDDRLGVPAHAGQVVSDGFGHVDGAAAGLA
jgi:hypothetical protein